MKYIDTEKLIAEIKRLKEKYKNLSSVSAKHKTDCYADLLSFINSLPEEKPSEDLELASQRSAILQYEMSTDIDKSMKVMEARIFHEIGFKAGAEWQKEQMIKDVVEGFVYQSADYYPKELIARYEGDLKMGDKVKIIIIKENKK